MTIIASVQPPECLGDVPGAMAIVIAEAEKAEAAGARLVCFPECFLQGYVPTNEYVSEHALAIDSADFAHVAARLTEFDITFVIGMIERDQEQCFNTAVVIQAGQVAGRYRKVHLLAGEQACFSAGVDYPVFDLPGLKFGINICYDLNFSDGASRVAAAGANLLVCPCNNMLRTKSAIAWKPRHNAIRSQRCREAGIWLLSSDVTGERDGRISFGPTALLDPQGQVHAQVELERAGSIICELPTDR